MEQENYSQSAVEIESLPFDSLQDSTNEFNNLDFQILVCNAMMQATDWRSTSKAIESLRSLNKYNPAYFKNIFEAVCESYPALLTNIRSGIRKSSLVLLGEVFGDFKDQDDQRTFWAVYLIPALLKVIAFDKDFLKEKAKSVLGLITENVLETEVFECLLGCASEDKISIINSSVEHACKFLDNLKVLLSLEKLDLAMVFNKILDVGSRKYDKNVKAAHTLLLKLKEVLGTGTYENCLNRMLDGQEKEKIKELEVNAKPKHNSSKQHQISRSLPFNMAC